MKVIKTGHLNLRVVSENLSDGSEVFNVEIMDCQGKVTGTFHPHSEVAAWELFHELNALMSNFAFVAE